MNTRPTSAIGADMEEFSDKWWWSEKYKEQTILYGMIQFVYIFKRLHIHVLIVIKIFMEENPSNC